MFSLCRAENVHGGKFDNSKSKSDASRPRDGHEAFPTKIRASPGMRAGWRCIERGVTCTSIFSLRVFIRLKNLLKLEDMGKNNSCFNSTTRNPNIQGASLTLPRRVFFCVGNHHPKTPTMGNVHRSSRRWMNPTTQDEYA